LGSENQQKKRTRRLTLLPDHPLKALERIREIAIIRETLFFCELKALQFV
jgi:hypothetical protein